MTKLVVIFSFFLLVILSVQVTVSDPVQAPAVCKTPGDVNPNGSSELSLLMRKMYDHAAAARKDVTVKKIPRAYPKEFLKIYTATPTDSTTKNSSFNPFADGYIAALNNFKSSSAGELVLNYNTLVTACINCHSQHCPGPVPKIRKLLVREAGK